ncbi:MAG: choice-of-anchor Q domain-containing protein [bacterium]
MNAYAMQVRLKWVAGPLVLAMALVSLAPRLVLADTDYVVRYVAPIGVDDSNDCTNPLQPCASISRAAAVSADGDTVMLAAGAYITSNLVISAASGTTRSITFSGEAATSTVIQADATAAVSRVLTCSGAGLTVHLRNLTITGGHSDSGGGLHVDGGSVHLADCRIVGNGTVDHNHGVDGGGIYVKAGTVTLARCTVAYNSTADADLGSAGGRGGSGGGLFNLGAVYMTNSTIAFNGTANGWAAYRGSGSPGSGGGIFNLGQLELHHCTVAMNTCGSMYNWYFHGYVYGSGPGICGAFTMGHTIIANNAVAATAVLSDGYNLVDTALVFANAATGNITGVQAKLDPYGMRGGPTECFSLAFDSPALNNGRPGLDADVLTDQRGTARVQAGRIDIGSYEASNHAPFLVSGTALRWPDVRANDGDPSGTPVASLFEGLPEGSVSDADPRSTTGLAVVAVSTDHGAWQFSTDAGINWMDLGSASETSATLLAAIDLVRFVPAPDFAGTATMTIRIWDQSCGLRGASFSATPNGGDSPFSSSSAQVSVTVRDDRYVSTSGMDVGDCGDPASPCRTIGYAMSQALTGGTVNVVSGLYRECIILDRDIGIKGSGADKTTLQAALNAYGNPSNRIVLVQSNVTASLIGLTLSRGGGLDEEGEGGAAVRNSGTLTIERCTLVDNHSPRGSGGAVLNIGTVTILNSLIARNAAASYMTASAAGALYNEGTATLRNCTLSHNSNGDGYAPADGGAIYNAGSLDIFNCTIVSNFARAAMYGPANGGGICNVGTLRMKQTILAHNTAHDGGAGPDAFGAIDSLGYNIITDLSGIQLTGNMTGNRIGAQPLLGPLGPHGGPTETYPILPGSPAYDGGDRGDYAIGGTDQRGLPRVQNACIDIGAYEVGNLVDLSVNKSVDIAEMSAFQPLTYTIDLLNGGYYSASEMDLIDELPEGVTFLAASSSPGWSLDGRTLSRHLAELGPGMSTSYTVRVELAQPRSDVLTNRVSLSTLSEDLSLANNADTATTTLLDVDQDDVPNADDADADDDGACNSDESIAGTNPFDTYDALQVKIDGEAVSNDPWLVTWPSVTGRLYTLMSCTNLRAEAAWYPVPSCIDVTGTGAAMVYTNDNPSAFRLFNVRVRLP